MIATLYDKFKPWSEGGSVWIISDPHFEDSDCKFMDPNWPTPQEQVDKINEKVLPSDTLIILGDVGNPEWMNKIKCRYRVLVMGNHDKGKTVYEPYFNEIYEGPLFIAEKILLSHEPILSNIWYNIHGHCHCARYNFDYIDYNVEEGQPLTYKVVGQNLASDVANYTPVNLKDIIKLGHLKTIDSIHRETINKAAQID